MIFRFRSVAIVVASAGYAHAALSGDDKTAPVLIGAPSTAWSRPAAVGVAPQIPARTAPVRAGFLPMLPSSFFGTSEGGSRLLFLSPLSPLRAALRVAAQDLATQTLAMIDPPLLNAAGAAGSAEDDSETAAASARKRDVILRQRRKSVLNERGAGPEKTAVAESVTESVASDLELGGLSGRVELLTLPSGSPAGQASESALPSGAGLVRVSGYLTDDLSFALTGLAAESAATTWRAGAEFELSAGERNRIEVGAVYGTRWNATNAPIGGDIDRRSVGAFRLVHSLQLSDNISTRAGGRFIDAPFLTSSRSIDPEFSLLIEDPDSDGGRTYLQLDVSGDTLFPGLEVATGGSDLLALSEGLPVFARNFEAQRSWTRGVAVGYRRGGSKVQARIQDQTVSNALLVIPSSVAGAALVTNGQRNRLQMGSVLFEKTFAHGQAQTGVEYGYGRFAADRTHPALARDFHQLTTRFDAYVRRSGTGIAIFHRIHDGAPVAGRSGTTHAQRYLIEFRQDVPFVPALIGADMAFLVGLRNVYYDDVDHRNIDEFAVTAPPRQITGGIRVKF
ncbi:MAG: hypothetical protein JJE39_11755 [Vicinamibacteria bacterium]|nr:hypothetical protein [Vicinamibacteria bacterium]